MSSAGWYPDPGGQPGLYRYWTGTAWTAAVTANPQATPPPSAPVGGPQGYPQGGQGFGQGGAGFPQGGQGFGQGGAGYPPGNSGYSQAGAGYPKSGAGYPQSGAGNPQSGAGYSQTGVGYSQTGVGYSQTGPQPTRKRATGWWVGGIAALVAIGLVIYFLVMPASAGGSGIFPGNPGGTATPDVCPAAAATAAPTPATSDPSRVSGGKLSFPRLGDPWKDPIYENRVPFGSLAREQEAVDQENYDGKSNDWVSSLLVSDLYVGDGFASTKSGAETVLKCVLGRYYSDAVVKESRLSSAAHPVDGHDGWLIESHLSFDIPGLNAKGEQLLLLVVQTGTDEYGLFFASVPDTSPDRLPDARAALADLSVDA